MNLAFVKFNDIYLYEVFKIHLNFRPTLKRLSAMVIIRHFEEEKTGKIFKRKWHQSLNRLAEEGQLPVTLYKDVVELGSSMWTVDVFYCGARLLDFTPELVDPMEVVGKEMVLTKTEYDVKVSFQSLTPGWNVNLVLWAIPKLFFVSSMFRENSTCLNEITSEDNVGKIKILFLQFFEGKYSFDFHKMNEKLDFSIGP